MNNRNTFLNESL